MRLLVRRKLCLSGFCCIYHQGFISSDYSRVLLLWSIDPPWLSGASIFAKLGICNIAFSSDISGQLISSCWSPFIVAIGEGPVAADSPSLAVSPRLGHPSIERNCSPLFCSPSVRPLARNNNIKSSFRAPLSQGALFCFGDSIRDHALGFHGSSFVEKLSKQQRGHFVFTYCCILRLSIIVLLRPCTSWSVFLSPSLGAAAPVPVSSVSRSFLPRFHVAPTSPTLFSLVESGLSAGIPAVSTFPLLRPLTVSIRRNLLLFESSLTLNSSC